MTAKGFMAGVAWVTAVMLAVAGDVHGSLLASILAVLLEREAR